MKFRKYSSIENTYQGRYLDIVKSVVPSSESWVVQEKIHGANFSIHYDGNDFRMAKRSGFIASDENFYGANLLSDKFSRMIRLLHQYLVSVKYLQQNDSLSLFGEYAGGYMPGYKSTGKSVQKGVVYSPNHIFIIFDVMVNNEYVNHNVFEMIRIRYNSEVSEWVGDTPIRFIEDLAITDLETALEFDVETFSSTIQGYFSEISRDQNAEELANIAEGVVIKPTTNYFYNDSRVVLKKKSKQFTEKKVKASPSIVEFSDDVKKVVSVLDDYINENRLNSVLSKEGLSVDGLLPKDFGKIMKLFSLDVIEDLRRDFGEIVKDKNDDTKRIFSELNTKISKYLKPIIIYK